MSEKTKNLGLFKYDTTTDAKQVFSIDKGMNENWDIIDSNTITKGQVTNCLWHVPYNVKVDVNYGTVTLRSGSIVTIPDGLDSNGNRKYKYQKTTQDYSQLAKNYSVDSNIFKKGNYIMGVYTKQCSAGTEPPTIASGSTAHYYWWDTTNNVIKFSSDAGTTWTIQTDMSLPVAKCKQEKDIGYTKLYSVYNGVGQMGSMLFVQTGTQALCGQGRNEEGAITNGSLTCGTMVLIDCKNWDALTGGSRKGFVIFQRCATGQFWAFQNSERFVGTKHTPTTEDGAYYYYFDEQEAQWYIRPGYASSWEKGAVFIFAQHETHDGYTYPIKPFKIPQTKITYWS